MIVVMQEQAAEQAIEAAVAYLSNAGCSVERFTGQGGTILSVSGEMSPDDVAVARELQGVAKVVPQREPFRLASRQFRSEPTLVQGDYGTIGGREPWIAIEPIGLEGTSPAGEDLAPVSASLQYRIAAGRPFDAAITRAPVAPDAVGALACLSVHRSPRDARFPVLFVARQPSWSADTWLQRAERELTRGGTEVVLLEAGSEQPSAERAFEVRAVLHAKERTHLPIVVDVPTIAGTVRHSGAIARAAIALGLDGVILRVFVGSGALPRAPATLSWDAAVELAEALRAIGSTTRK